MERRIPPSPPFAQGGADSVEVAVSSFEVGGADDTNSCVPPFEKGGTGGIPDYDRKLALTDFAARLKSNASTLRKRQTDAEQCLWLQLRRDQLGVRFLRQRPLGQYIVDFYAPKARLVIELDGSQHMDDPKQRDKDQRRDAWLRSRGLKVLRFDDRQVLTETRAVMEVIFKVVEEAVRRGIPPSPPFSKGGEPRCVTEGSLPFVKGGQEGFDDASQTDPLQD